MKINIVYRQSAAPYFGLLFAYYRSNCIKLKKLILAPISSLKSTTSQYN